jgi:N-methylhydantoinase A
LGLLLADTKFDMSRTMIVDGVAENLAVVNEQFQSMIQQGTESLDREEVPQDRRRFEFSIDMRYQRQNFEINIPVSSGKISKKEMEKAIRDFHAEHKRSYGYCNEKAAVQFVSYRVSAIGIIDKPEMKPAPLTPDAPLPKPIETRKVLFQGKNEYVKTPVYQRFDFVPGQTLCGPCILEQMDTTLVVPKNWTLHVDGYENLLIKDNEVN